MSGRAARVPPAARARHAETAARWAGTLYLAAVYAFILGPALVVMVGSFNSARTFPSTFESATLRWYAELLGRPDFLMALRLSAVVAALAGALASLVSLPAAFAIVRAEFPGKDLLVAFFMAPLILPQIILGLAVLQLASLAKMPLSPAVLVLAHTVVVIPYAMRALITSLTHFDRSLEDAAMNLGARPVQTWLLVTFPLIKSGLTGGSVLAFIMSFVNVPLSLFLTTAQTMTLPIRVLNYMESRIDPLVAAIATLLIVMVCATSLFLEKVLRLRLLT